MLVVFAFNMVGDGIREALDILKYAGLISDIKKFADLDEKRKRQITIYQDLQQIIV